ncbi:hypothetical protein U2U65_003496 [Vibrio cholerae]|nr:hypothetical protein [Vibrio cholerae]HAS5006266.1 hypothetical protein [Vibrio cholerae]
MKRKNIDLKKAMSLFGLESLDGISLRALKRLYKRAVFKVHPDKGGNKEDAQLLNTAYSALLDHGVFLVGADDEESNVQQTKSDTTDSSTDDKWFYDRNNGHPLHACHLASMYTLDSLIQQTFNVVSSDASFYKVFGTYTGKPDRHFYMKNGEQHLAISGREESLSITDVTNAGKARKQCVELSLNITNYNPNYPRTNQSFARVLCDWFGSRIMSDEFRFGWVFNHLMSCVHHARHSGSFRVHDVVYTAHKDSWNEWVDVKVSGHLVRIYVNECPSQDFLTPFTLNEWKPLDELPSRWTIKHLVRLLVNGQFHHIKRDYYYTDDYAYDAACGYRKGYIDNPLHVACQWVGEKKRSCTSLHFSDDRRLSFGFHSNDSSSLIVDLNNRFLLEDVNTEVAFFEETFLKLSA